jgi:serine phosphatase RsbU (regulator of sigma subunit)/HAMP domain-containing protein
MKIRGCKMTKIETPSNENKFKRNPFKSIKTQIFFGIGILIFILLPLTGYHGYQSGKTGIESQIEQQTVGFANQALDKINYHLTLASYAVNLTNNLARKKIVKFKNPDEILQYFDELKKTYAQFQNFYYGDEQGNFWMVPRQKPETELVYDPRVRPWYVKAMISDKFCWTDVYKFSSSRRPGITAAKKVLSDNGEPLGVVGVDIDLSALSIFLKKIKFSKNGESFILDHKGRFVAHPNMDNIEQSHKNKEIISMSQSVLENKKLLTKSIVLNNEKYFAAMAPHVDKKWVVCVLIPYKDFMSAISGMKSSFLVIFTISIFLGFILARYISSFISKPLEELLFMVRKIKGGDFDIRIEPRADDEIGALALEFNEMISLLNQRMFQLSSLHNLGEMIKEIFDLPNLLNTIIHNAAISMRSKKCSIALWSEASESFHIRTAIGFNEGGDKIVENLPNNTASPILMRVKELHRPILVSDLTTDPRFSDIISFNLKCSDEKSDNSFLAVPLIGREKFHGIMSVSKKENQGVYNEDDLKLLVILAGQIVTAIDNAKLYEELLVRARLDKELEIAHNIQQRLLPPPPPAHANISMAANYIPAAEVSGDYFDFLFHDDNNLQFALGDVSGKGIPASMLMIMLRSLLRYEASMGKLNLGDTITKVNTLLLKDIEPTMFVTLIYGNLNYNKMEFEFVNAGHCWPVLVHEDGTITKLKESSLLLGMFENIQYSTRKAQMKKGDILFIFSDGIEDVENESEEKMGLDPVINMIVRNRHLGAPTISNEIVKMVEQHKGSAKQFDDITYVVIKIQG